VAPAGSVLVSADYSAIELRILADVTQDAALMDVFAKGRDPHITTAALVLGKPEAEVSKKEREQAKAVNYGSIYGMGGETFAEHAASEYDLILTIAEAKQFLAAYLDAYPGVRAWRDTVGLPGVSQTKTNGGRVRKLGPDDYNKKLNSPIQGTCADGMKAAMVLLDARLGPFGARMVLCIHDEILVEAPEHVAEEVLKVVETTMIEGMTRYVKSVPILVDAKLKKTWWQ
jgi:DNA polymerase I-like protein with 3'-5' exonuclease and polymerase domains